MPFAKLEKPFSNVTDVAEQKVLAIVRHLAPHVSEWRKGTELREELAEADGCLPALQRQQSAATEALSGVNTELAQVWKAPLTLGSLGLAVLFLGLMFYKTPFLFAAIAAGGFGVWRGLSTKIEVAGRKSKVETALAQVSTQLTQTQQTVARLKKQLGDRATAFPKVTLARVAFGLERKELLGRTVVMDLSGIWPAQTLKTLDLSAMGEGVQNIRRDVEALRNAPVLLSPDHATGEAQELEKLYGEEARLQAIVEQYVSTLSRVSDVSVSLPLVPASESVAQALATGDGAETVKTTGATLIAGSSGDTEQISRFVRFVNENREQAESTLDELKLSFDALANACDVYAQARVFSINYLHQQIFDTLDRASMCSKNFYCPRTIQAPAYLYSLANVDIDSAHEIEVDELLERLAQDPVFSSRLADQPEIAKLMRYSWERLQEAASHDRAKWLKSFRQAVSHAITGSRVPVLAFSDRARLYLDPDTETWSSPVVPYEYKSPDVVRYGQMLKATTDLMFPMWSHLWTEKADFRKSELFRSNELLIQMGEKESEKLIEIGNQFRADMRSVRENLYLVEAEINSKVDEIKTFCDGMASIGLLSARQKKISEEQLRIVAGDGSVLQKALDCETTLSLMPQVQSATRGTVSDPIDMIRTPSLLLPGRGAAASAPLALSRMN